MVNTIGGLNLNTMEEINSFLSGYRDAKETNSEDSFLEYMRNTESQRYASYTTNTTSSSTTNIDSTTTQQVLDSLSKDYTNIENLEPIDISYEDYKKLTYKAIEVIFNGNSDKIAEASGLMSNSQLTDDDILNKIYYDEELNANEENTTSEYSKTLMLVAIMELNLNIEEHGLNTDEYTSSNGQLTKDQLFSNFDKFKQYYQDTIDTWSDFIDINEVFESMDEIKSLYNEKVEENNAILNSLLRNTREQII